MISFQKKENGLIRRYPIIGGRRLSNYWWSIVIFLGGCGFLFTGISSFFNRNLLQIIPPLKIEHVSRLTPGIINPSTSLMTFSCLDKKIFTFDVPTSLVTPIDSTLYVPLGSTIRNDKNFPFEERNNEAWEPSFSYQNTDTLFIPEIKPTVFPIFSVKPRVSYLPTGCVSPKTCLDKKDEQVPTLVQEICLTGNMPCKVEKRNLVSTILTFLPFQGMQSFSFHFFPWIVDGVERISYSKIGGYIKGKIYSISIGNLGLNIANGIPILPFFPQGLVLSFYGFLGLCFSFHLWFTLLWKIGAGFNEVNGKEKSIRIFRWGKPGKNRRIDLKYSNELIDTIKIELFPKPALFLCIKGDKKIPLTRLGEFIPLEDLETQAAELTSLLQVPLEIEELST